MKLANLSILISLLSYPILAADLKIEIKGAPSNQGELLVAVYDKAESFLKRPVRAQKIPASGSTEISFAQLAEGDYAVAVIHDENSNGKLDANPFGMPIEAWGFSNDAIGNMGPPQFEQAKIYLDSSGKTILVQLRS